MDDIIYHITNGHAVCSDDAFVTSWLVQKTQRWNNKAWFLCVRYKYGSDYCVALKDLKESKTVEVAGYAAANKLVYVPPFYLWVPYCLRKQNCIIGAVNCCINKFTHKYDI